MAMTSQHAADARITGSRARFIICRLRYYYHYAALLPQLNID